MSTFVCRPARCACPPRPAARRFARISRLAGRGFVMTQHRSPNRAARHLLDLDARYRERLHRGHPSATVATPPADGTLLDVVPLPDTGKVLMIVAHGVPASAAMPGSPPENSPPDAPGAAPPDPAPVPGEGSDAPAPAGVRPRPAAAIRPATREPAPEPGALPDGLRIDAPSRRRLLYTSPSP